MPGRSSAGRTTPPADRPRCPRSECAQPSRSAAVSAITPLDATHFAAAPRAARQAGEQLVVPVAGVDVEEQRARRVAGIGDVGCAAGEFPDEPAVDGAEREFARLRPRARAGDVVEHPASFVPEKYASSTSPVFAANSGSRPRAFSRSQRRCRAPVLPHDRVAYGLAGRAVPHDGRLALIGDADGGDVARGESGPCDGFGGHAHLGYPDFVRVVLDPSRLREYLAKLFLRYRLDRAAPRLRRFSRDYGLHYCCWRSLS